ncbi:MAG: dienelactone hydrolase family protein [Deltaproteobacteria bacterium]|nr:dienelactone hydrolase family protein [Deltaproteobacteria bacterium]
MIKTKPIISWGLVGILVIATVMLASADDTVTFQGTTKTKAGDFVMLMGKLSKPKGDGPFPAVVLLQGCRGTDKAQDAWAERFASWGYVALQVDGLAARGEKNICATPFSISFPTRVQDAYDSKSYLGGLPFVDRNRIAVAGWGHGGALTIASVSPRNYHAWASINTAYSVLARKPEAPFRAAVAFYPWICVAQLNDSEAPLLILTGESDLVAPVAFLRANMPSEKTPYEVILKVYPGAYHTFDSEGTDSVSPSGVRLKYDPAATADAIVRVRDFLAKHLR